MVAAPVNSGVQGLCALAPVWGIRLSYRCCVRLRVTISHPDTLPPLRRDRYDRMHCKPKVVRAMQVLAAMAPPGGGRNAFSQRILAVFSSLVMAPPSAGQLRRIFTTLLSAKLADFDEAVRAVDCKGACCLGRGQGVALAAVKMAASRLEGTCSSSHTHADPHPFGRRRCARWRSPWWAPAWTYTVRCVRSSCPRPPR